VGRKKARNALLTTVLGQLARTVSLLEILTEQGNKLITSTQKFPFEILDFLVRFASRQNEHKEITSILRNSAKNITCIK